MLKMLHIPALLAMGVLSVSVYAYAAQTRSVATPPGSYGLDLVHYNTVERSDGSYRRMFIERSALGRLRPGQPFPDGTRILMETYLSEGSLGTVFHKQKVNGRWQYGSFPGLGRPDLSVAPRVSCLSCHSRAARTDFTYTRPGLDAVAAGAQPAQFLCARRGRTPCSLTVYRNGAVGQ